MSSRILLVDDHAIIRRGLRNLLTQRMPGTELRDASSLAELQIELQRVPAPDLVVLDLQLADGNAFDHLEHLRQAYPQVKILVYTMVPERIFAERVLALGCAGYLTKECSEEEVVRAITSVLNGGSYMSPGTEQRLAERLRPGSNGRHENPFEYLSVRELRVADELLSGAGIKEIAARMDLGPTTVATYKARLFDKLGVTNLLELQELARTYRNHRA